MVNYYFAILCLALLLANESYGSSFFCPSEVLESLIHCLLRTDINSRLEVHGLSVYKFNRRLECAKQAKCYLSPLQIWDEKIQLVRQFVECMEEIPDRIGIVHGVYEGSAILYLHVFERQCREKLAKQLPHDLQKYYLPLLGLKVI